MGRGALVVGKFADTGRSFRVPACERVRCGRDGVIEAGVRRVFAWPAACPRALPLCHRHGGAVGAWWWLSSCAVAALLAAYLMLFIRRTVSVLRPEIFTPGGGVTPRGGTYRTDITHGRTQAAGHAHAEGPQGVCGGCADVCMPLARVRERGMMVWAWARSPVCAREWQCGGGM